MLLRALQDDVAEDDLCGARPGRALGVSPEWHKELLAGLVSIPEVQPGDTVWWHTDICHAVGDEHAGQEDASVIYIGSAPGLRPRTAALIFAKTEGGVPRRPLGARLRGDGLRGRFPGPRLEGGPDRARPAADGILSANAPPPEGGPGREADQAARGSIFGGATRCAGANCRLGWSEAAARPTSSGVRTGGPS